MGRRPLVAAVAWFAAGIALGLVRPVPPLGGPLLVPGAVVGAIVALAALLPRARAPAPSGRWPRSGSTRGVLLLIGAGGLLLGVAERRAADGSCLHRLPDGAPLEFLATVESSVGERVRLTLDSIRVGPAQARCGVEVGARFPPRDALEPRAGDRIRVRGRWWSPPGPAPRLRRPGTLLVDFAASAPDPASLSREPVVERLRRRSRERVDRLYGTRAPLVASLLLAQRDALDADVRNRFARAGLSHLLAISGLHVGLVAGILLLVGSLLRRSRGASSAAAAGGTLAYVAFLGAPHSAVRAALQITLVLAARGLQRPADSASLMAAAAFALLLSDPGALVSPGFQLSFAGVAGILVLRRPLLRMARPLTRIRPAGVAVGTWLADGTATSLAATVGTAPVVAWHFGQIAPVGVVANLAAIPLVGLAVPATAIPLLLDPVWPAAAAFLAPSGGLLLGLLDRVAAAAAGVPWATAPVTGHTALLVTGAILAGWAVARRGGRLRPLVRVTVWAGVSVAVLVVAPLRAGGERIEIHMIDVGQGDAVALRSPAGRWVLVDAGVAGAGFDAGDRLVVPYLARRGVRRIEGLILTHPDADHTGGAAAVVRALRPRWIGDPAVAVGKALYLDALDGALARGIRWLGLQAGMDFELDGLRIDILHPPAFAMVVDDANDASIIARVRYGEFDLLLMGDAPASAEHDLLTDHGGALEAEVLKVGHHGSHTSTAPAFLEAARPRLALVSAGRDNRYGHPHPRVLRDLMDRGVHVARTDRHGSVVVRARSDGTFDVETERGTLP